MAALFFLEPIDINVVASSVWAISRPLPGKHFLKDWNFSRSVVTQDGDHFLFADFVVAVAAFVDGLDDRFELFLRDHGLFLCLHGAFAIGTFALFDFGCLTFAPSKKCCCRLLSKFGLT